MDHGDSQRQAVQGINRPHHRPRQYHRNRYRVLSVQAYPGKAQGQGRGNQDLIPRRRRPLAAGETEDELLSRAKRGTIKTRRGGAKTEDQNGARPHRQNQSSGSVIQSILEGSFPWSKLRHAQTTIDQDSEAAYLITSVQYMSTILRSAIVPTVQIYFKVNRPSGCPRPRHRRGTSF
jgi:hypothetical protein